jgi:colanic acid biosynthesis glycosyl transferase WcaI
MKIIIYGINFSPEEIGIGKYTGELAEWLSNYGWEVCALSAPPYYPAWEVSPEYSSWRYAHEITGRVRVVRCPLYIPRSPNGFKRILHLLSFALSSFPILLKEVLAWKPDVVLAVEPPFFGAIGAAIAARLGKVKSWLHIQDLEIDAAFDLNLLPSPILRTPVRAIERYILHRFDRVSTISKTMMVRVQEKGIPKKNLILFPNWVDTNEIKPLDSSSSIRKEFGIPDDTIIALYSGNMGSKQGLELIVEAARMLEDTPGVRFLICGGGPALKKLIKQAEGLNNIEFSPLQPADRFNDLLNVADIHLLPQRAEVSGLVMPSKLGPMMASGRPVIVTTDKASELGEVAAIGGVVIPPEDSSAFSKAVLDLATNDVERDFLGSRGHKYVEGHWSKEKVLSKFMVDLTNLLAV